jgi:hypothetical protein
MFFLSSSTILYFPKDQTKIIYFSQGQNLDKEPANMQGRPQ